MSLFLEKLGPSLICKNPNKIISIAISQLNSGELGMEHVSLALIDAILLSHANQIDKDCCIALELSLKSRLTGSLATDDEAWSLLNHLLGLVLNLKAASFTSASQNAQSPSAEDYQIFHDALRDLKDDLIPNRAFGVDQLRTLIVKRSVVVSNDLETIFGIILSQVRHPDTFLHLNAMRTLDALIEHHSNVVKPMLLQSFSMESDLLVRQRMLKLLNKH